MHYLGLEAVSECHTASTFHGRFKNRNAKKSERKLNLKILTASRLFYPKT
jgi:hypothetical protein